jgi:hypothetical protein
MTQGLVFWLVLVGALIAAGYAVLQNPGDWWLALLALGAVVWMMRAPQMKRSFVPQVAPLASPVQAEQSAVLQTQVVLACRDPVASETLYRDVFGLGAGEQAIGLVFEPLVSGAALTQCRLVVRVQGIGSLYQRLLVKGLISKPLEHSAAQGMQFEVQDADQHRITFIEAVA